MMIDASSLIAAGIAGVGIIVAAGLASFTASRELVLKRQLESSDRFLGLVSILENRTGQGVDIGLNRQIAAGWLIAEFGKHNDFLKKTAEETLRQYATIHQDISALHRALEDALAWLQS